MAFTTATVNGLPARSLAGNVFEADLDMQAGANAVTLRAVDASGNVTTRTYSLNVMFDGATYTYDANGNLSTKTTGSDTWAYTWNAENQLTRVTKNGAEMATFKYDPVGRRVEKVASGVTTTWAYDGEDILRETRGTSTTTYIHGPGIDEPLAKVDQSGDTTYLHADGLGSIVKETNSAGTVTLTRQYDAWGNLEVGADQPGYAFTGREWDPEIDLYYYRARYYDPKVGRFVSEDPIGFAGGGNFYLYAGANPPSAIDPDGKAWEHKTGQWKDCGGGCRVRIDSAGGTRHLHWECGRGSASGTFAEYGGRSHGLQSLLRIQSSNVHVDMDLFLSLCLLLNLVVRAIVKGIQSFVEHLLSLLLERPMLFLARSRNYGLYC